MPKVPFGPPSREHRTTLLLLLWIASVGFVLVVFAMSISAAGFFGGSIGDGFRMAFEYQPWLAGLSLTSVAVVALYHWLSRKA